MDLCNSKDSHQKYFTKNTKTADFLFPVTVQAKKPPIRYHRFLMSKWGMTAIMHNSFTNFYFEPDFLFYAFYGQMTINPQTSSHYPLNSVIDLGNAHSIFDAQ